jgi:single-strand DNA-binding protein
MRSINAVILSGHLGQDPEENGAVKFSLAVNDVYSNEDGKQERVNWVPIVCFGKVGDIAKQYLHKGSHVAVQGSLRQNVYEPESQKKQTRTEVIAQTLTLLDKKPQEPADSNPAPAETKKGKTSK